MISAFLLNTATSATLILMSFFAQRSDEPHNSSPPQESVWLAKSTPIVFHPFHDFSWDACFSPEELAAVRALEAIPDDAIDGLLRSDDSHLIGVGLYLADERELPEFFLRYPEILSNNGPSPLVRCSNVRYEPDMPAHARYQSIARSVGVQYKNYITSWFGVAVGSERAFREDIAPDADPWLEVRTWRMIASRAIRSEDPARIARVRDRMLQSPPQVRWLVVPGLASDHLRGGPGSLFTDEEARQALRDLDPALRQAIREERAPLTPQIEKAIANDDKPEERRTQYYERAKRLLEDPGEQRP